MVAPLGIAFNLLLMCSLDTATWIRFVVWSFIGLLLYFMYSARHSNLNNNQ